MRLYGVESENGVFVRMIQRVRLDLEETERLLLVPSVKEKLISIPGKLPWIKGVVLSTKGALNEIGRWVERVRADKDGYGSVSFENKVRWVFNDQEKLVHRSMELRTSHQTLSTVLGYLTPLEQTTTPLPAGPPAYEDVTFFDDFLSPRQKRMKAQHTDTGRHTNEKREDEGTLSRESCCDLSHTNLRLPGVLNQSTPVPRSICPTPQPKERNEIQSGGDIKTSGEMSSFQISDPHPSSSWTAISEKASNISLAPSTTGTNLFPILTPTTSFSEPTVQEWSSSYCETVPSRRPSSGFGSIISGGSVSPNIPVPSVQLSMTQPFATTSPIPSLFAPTSLPAYSGQAGPLILPTSTHSWTHPPGDSSPMIQQVDTTILHRTPGVPGNSSHLEATSSTYLPPPLHPPIPPPAEFSDTASLCAPTAYSQTISFQQPSSSIMSPLPEKAPLQQASHTFSATNSPGPVDPYELWAELEPCPISNGNARLDSRLPSRPAAVELFSPIQRPKSTQNPPPCSATSYNSAVHDNIAELMSEMSVRHPKSYNSLAELSSNFPSTESQSNDSFKELSPNTPSWTFNSRSETPGNTTAGRAAWPNFATEVPAEPYYALERSQNPPPESVSSTVSLRYTEMPSINISQIPQSHYPSPSSPPPSSPPQPQAQSQPQLWHQNQYQYQPYRPALPTPCLLDPISTSTPSPLLLVQQQQQTTYTPVSPPTQPATPAQSVTSFGEQQNPLSRSATVVEARRRQQKALLALMDRGSYG